MFFQIKTTAINFDCATSFTFNLYKMKPRSSVAYYMISFVRSTFLGKSIKV